MVVGEEYGGGANGQIHHRQLLRRQHPCCQQSQQRLLQQDEGRGSSCKNIKDFLFTGGFRNGRIMDPARALLGLTAAEIWDSDPIHPKADIYNILAKSVIQVELTCGSGQAKRKRSQRDGSGTFAGREGGGGRGGGGRQGGTGAHGGANHGDQPARAHGDGVGAHRGVRGYRGQRGWGGRGVQWREGPSSGRRPSRRPGGSHYRW